MQRYGNPVRGHGLRNTVFLEASGNITFDTLDEWFECGVDVISTSAINRSETARYLDDYW